MSAKNPISGSLNLSLQTIELFHVEIQFPWSIGTALISTTTTILYSTFTPPYVSKILYKNALICFRYAAFKRHPE